jgi:hypothetical protein
MYLEALRASARRTFIITCIVPLVASAIVASYQGWRNWPRLFAEDAMIAVFVGSFFWVSIPIIDAYSKRLRLHWQWVFRIVNWTLVYNAGVLAGMAAQASLGVFPWGRYASNFGEAFLPGTLISTICCTAFTIHMGVKYQSQYEIAQARLSSLESRLRPHFLFNTLNSIVALIPEDPASAERVTVKLADLLRYSLDSADRSTVLLEQELKVTTDYLEIEKTRFGSRLSYSIDVPPELLHTQVPPFCLQTLVENSVKYGGGEIRVHACNGAGKLILTIWDSGDGFTGKPKEIPGHGLHDLRKRLAALWGNHAALEFPQQPSGATVQISIPT